MANVRNVLLFATGASAVGLSALALRRVRRAIAHPSHVTASVTINKSPREVYELFRDFSRLPEFMTYLAEVEEDGPRSTWTAVMPIVGKVTWRARITEDVPGSVLAWESEPGSRVRTQGRVDFTKAPGRDSTEVRVELRLGFLGATPNIGLARLFAAPQVKGDLRRLKQVLETGEVLRSDASAHRKPHPAQPSPEAEPAPDFFIPHPANVAKGAVS